MTTNVVFDGPERGHGRHHGAGKGRTVTGVEIEELAPCMRPAPGKRHGVIGAPRLAQSVIGSVTVDLQDPAIAIEMPGDAFA